MLTQRNLTYLCALLAGVIMTIGAEVESAEVVLSELGDDAGLVGAGTLVWERAEGV